MLVEEDSLLNTRDKEKQTPLLIAKQHEEKQDTIAYLIEMTPPALDRKDAVKSTPLRAAIVPRAEEKSMMTIVTFQNVLMVISIAGLLSLAWYRLCKKKGRPQEEKL